MAATPQYNRIIRKITVAFGSLFNNIQLVRYNPDDSEQERMIVPLDYATKELYVMRLESDPNLDKKVQITLPRMSYELNGISYDPTRKQQTNMQNFYQSSSGVNSQYVPVPYNFDYSLYLYVRNIEDGNQIIEYILPFFTPDYTLNVNMIPEMGIVKEIPIILNKCDYEVTYEGDRNSDTRTVIWTLNFTVKGFIFGSTTSNIGLIRTSITNIYDTLQDNQNLVFTLNSGGSGSYRIGETVFQGPSAALSVASAKVVSSNTSNNQVTLTSISGNFVSNAPILGVQSNASWTFNTYLVEPIKYANITVTPNPLNANANSSYTYTDKITEYIH